MHQSKMLRRIRAEARLETTRKDLLKVVRGFLGEQFASDVASAISSLDDQTRLDHLFDGVVLQGMSQEAFRAALATTAQTP